MKENLGKKIDNQGNVKSTRSNKNKIRRNSKVVKTEREEIISVKEGKRSCDFRK